MTVYCLGHGIPSNIPQANSQKLFPDDTLHVHYRVHHTTCSILWAIKYGSIPDFMMTKGELSGWFSWEQPYDDTPFLLTVQEVTKWLQMSAVTNGKSLHEGHPWAGSYFKKTSGMWFTCQAAFSEDGHLCQAHLFYQGFLILQSLEILGKEGLQLFRPPVQIPQEEVI